MSLIPRNRLDWLSFLAAFPVAITLAWLVTATIDRAPPVTYLEAYARGESVPAGGTVAIHFAVDRARICRVLSVARYLEDSTGTVHAVTGYTVPSEPTRRGPEVYERTITVPPAAAPGRAAYFVRLRYACNALQVLSWPIEVESPRVPLLVLPATSGGMVLTPLPEPRAPP